jgi:anti-sigma regulatory factor (Ser/Thr protein kinase)
MSSNLAVNDRYAAAVRSEVSFRVSEPAEVCRINPLVARVKDRVRNLGYPASAMELDIPLALTEALANAVVHGNKSDPRKRVVLAVEATECVFRCSVTDQGGGFDYSSVPPPGFGEEEPLSHGRGIMLIRSLMTEVSYNRAGNQIRMALKFDHGNCNDPQQRRLMHGK